MRFARGGQIADKTIERKLHCHIIAGREQSRWPTPADVLHGAGFGGPGDEWAVKGIVAGQCLRMPVIGIPGVSPWSTAWEPLAVLSLLKS